MSVIGSLLCLAALLAVAFTWGHRWNRRRPSLAKIAELRQALARATPPQFATQMPAADFHGLLEQQLRTYLEFGGDLTPPKPFQRAGARDPMAGVAPIPDSEPGERLAFER